MIRPLVSAVASVRETPVFARIWLIVVGLGAYAGLVVVFDRYVLREITTLTAQLHALLGLILGLLLVFRTNTSYDRWWEGRKLWGQLVNDSRNLAIKVQTFVQAPPEDKQQFGRLLADFAIALRDHLRQGNSPPVPDQLAHTPIAVTTRVYDQLERWRRDRRLGGIEMWLVDQHAAALMNICGACERIQKTPIALSYRRFIRQSIAIYLITLPWGLMETFGYWTVPAMLLLSYFMIGVEAIAEHTENPFGETADDLLLDDLCVTIERSLTEILGAGVTRPGS